MKGLGIVLLNAEQWEWVGDSSINETQLSYLTDQSSPFGEDKAQLLDELTFAIKNNAPQVCMHLSRPSSPTRCGGCQGRLVLLVPCRQGALTLQNRGNQGLHAHPTRIGHQGKHLLPRKSGRPCPQSSDSHSKPTSSILF